MHAGWGQGDLKETTFRKLNTKKKKLASEVTQEIEIFFFIIYIEQQTN